MNINSKVIKGCIAAVGLTAAIIMNFEGKSNTIYPDPVEIPTVCYGHVLTPTDHKGTYTDKECMTLLLQDIGIAEKAVERYVKVDITPDQKEALVSFVYNVGSGNFRSSTLLRKLNKGDIVGACNEMPRWVYSKGIKLRGLVKRRELERQWCLR